MRQTPAFRSFVVVILLFSFSGQAAWAERDPLGLLKDTNTNGVGSEYVYRNDPEEILVPVFLMGAVGRPGLYHIPVKTDLITLLTLAGGPTDRAVMDDVIIKKQQTKEVEKVDLAKLVGDRTAHSPLLNNNDIVLVQTIKPAISNDTVLVVTMVTTVLTIVLTAFAISKLKGGGQ